MGSGLMTGLAAFVDSEAVLVAWVNLQDTLVGQDKPLALGAHLKHLRSPAKGCYALITRAGGGPVPGDEAPIDLARMSASIYGSTMAAASLAATAYANALLSLDGTPQLVTVTRDGKALLSPGVIWATDQVTILHSPDGAEERYLVDALVAFTPAP